MDDIGIAANNATDVNLNSGLLFYTLLKVETPINITSEHKETFDSVIKALSDACGVAVKQPFPGKQLVLATDGCFRSAGLTLMIKDKTEQKR